MSQELNLLPCPFCGSAAIFKMSNSGCALVMCSQFTPCCSFHQPCDGNENSSLIPNLIEQWNTRYFVCQHSEGCMDCIPCDSIPRALTWTTEPPKVPGHYWCRYKSEGKEAWSVAYVPAVTDWDKRDMNEHDGIGWAGPIPEPQEPTP